MFRTSIVVSCVIGNCNEKQSSDVNRPKLMKGFLEMEMHKWNHLWIYGFSIGVNVKF